MGPPKDYEQEVHGRVDDQSFMSLPWYKKAVAVMLVSSAPIIFGTIFSLIGILWDRTGKNDSRYFKHDSDIEKIESRMGDHESRIRQIEWLLPKHKE